MDMTEQETNYRNPRYAHIVELFQQLTEKETEECLQRIEEKFGFFQAALIRLELRREKVYGRKDNYYDNKTTN